MCSITSILSSPYPNLSEAYSIGLQQGGKKKARFQLLTDDVKKTIKETYSSGEGGSTYISKKLAEQGIDLDASTIRKFVSEEVEVHPPPPVTITSTRLAFGILPAGAT